ncbi:MAG TPA: outer membrane lipoprotein carrier protein LolA [Flavobacteriia bacterium]|nr:outer membrane lipoprotein carrier protein LolA [Flavobacteriia bacterium]
MKKIIALVIVLISIQIQAQDSAKKLLDDVSNTMKNYKTIYIEFSNSLDNKAENVHQTTKGNASIQGEKYVVNMLGVTTIFDGKKMITINPEDEEVTISEVDEEDDFSPAKFFTFYKDNYHYEKGKEITKNGRKLQYIRLIPIDSNSDFSQVILVIDSKTKHIQELIQKGKNGSDITLKINQFKSNMDLPSKLFSFDKKKYEEKGYLINEL